MNFFKKLLHFLITLGVLAGLGFVLWTGVRNQRDKPAVAEEAAAASADAAPAEEETREEFIVMLDQEKATALAIEKVQPRKMDLQARRMAFGTVMNPAPLIALDGDVAAAEAALKASKAANDRTLTLAATNDTTKKALDASEAQYEADKIKVDGLIRGAQLEWGGIFTSDDAKRRAFMDELISGTVALLRVDVMPGEALAAVPKAARILVIGRENEPITTTDIIPATSANPKTQAQGFILRVKPPFTLRPGMALTAWMELPEKPRPGFAIPRGAILRHDGRTWVYAQEEAEKYVRKPLTLDTPLEADQGWFITEGAGLTEDDVIVVVGASSLLSEELKAQGGGELE